MVSCQVCARTIDVKFVPETRLNLCDLCRKVAKKGEKMEKKEK